MVEQRDNSILLLLRMLHAHLLKGKLHRLSITQAAESIVVDDDVGLVHKHVGSAIVRGNKPKSCWVMVGCQRQGRAVGIDGARDGPFCVPYRRGYLWCC